jgi:hypothetical protein
LAEAQRPKGLLVMFPGMRVITRAEASEEINEVPKYASRNGIHLILDLIVLKLCRERERYPRTSRRP